MYRGLMKCKRCGNKDPAYFYKGHKGYYCRKCIRFSRILLEEELFPLDYEIAEGSEEYSFDYKLTDQQLEASRKCVGDLKYGDVLLYCVCGAGKTEIAVASISEYLSRGLKVAYAISRREVVIELTKRFEKIFSKAKVTGVYGGHHDELKGDLIVCTCHQLFRYYQTFDLLILDEADAFPLKGNETLMNISVNACKGRVLYSTATVDETLRKVMKRRPYRTVELYVRPSFRPLTVPKVFYLPRYLALFILFLLLRQMDNQCIIFTTSKHDCEVFYKIFSRFFSCTYVYADLPERKQHIEDFREKKYRFIFATTVLERGITIKNISVIILNFASIFNQSNLIQMLGRVGRGTDSVTGDAYVISDHLDPNIRETLKYLKKANTYL